MSTPNIPTSQYTTAGTMPSQSESNARNATNDPLSNAPGIGQNNGGGRSGDYGDNIPSEQQNLPEQKHAGAVGYGPDYANKNKASLGDKITGVKDQLVGKITNNPELVQRGHDRKVGGNKRNEQDEYDPFSTGDKQDSPELSNTTSPPGVRTAPNEDVTGGTRGYTGPYGGNSIDADTTAGESRYNTDPSQGASYNNGVTQPGEV